MVRMRAAPCVYVRTVHSGMRPTIVQTAKKKGETLATNPPNSGQNNARRTSMFKAYLSQSKQNISGRTTSTQPAGSRRTAASKRTQPNSVHYSRSLSVHYSASLCGHSVRPASVPGDRSSYTAALAGCQPGRLALALGGCASRWGAGGGDCSRDAGCLAASLTGGTGHDGFREERGGKGRGWWLMVVWDAALSWSPE